MIAITSTLPLLRWLELKDDEDNQADALRIHKAYVGV